MSFSPFLVSPGIWRGCPRPTSAADYKTLYDLGIRTVLSLESGILGLLSLDMDAEIEWALDSGINLVHYPLSPIFPPHEDDLDRIVKFMAKNQPCYVHCKDSVDRTGCVIAAWKVKVLGLPCEDVIQDMYAQGFHRLRYWWWVPKLRAYLKKT